MYSSNGSMLPGDLMTEILKRLPVDSILRCTAVCKPWSSVISTPGFINSQLLYALTQPGPDQILISYHPQFYPDVDEEDDDDDDADDYSIPLLNVESCEFETPLGLPYSKGDFSFEPDYKIVGSFNGIVCVCVYKYPRQRVHKLWRYSDIDNNPNVYIWNPATRQSKLIPRRDTRKNASHVVVGFGFDPIGNDFKFLRVSFSLHWPIFAEVYSANTDVWRQVDPSPTDFPEFADFEVCKNGVLCGMGSFGIIAFDLNREVFTCGVRIPDKCFGVITFFNDCIAYMSSNKEDSNTVISLWTLDDEACLRDGGIEASWSLMLSVDVGCSVESVLGYFNSGDLMFKTENEDEHFIYLLYDSTKKEVRYIPVSIPWRPIFKYIESMVSVTGFRQVNWKARVDDNQ